MRKKVILMLSLLLAATVVIGGSVLFLGRGGERVEKTETPAYNGVLKNQITCSVAGEDTLVIQGEGELKCQVLSYALDKKKWAQIKKIKIGEGITKLDSGCFRNTVEDDYRIEEIFIADSVKEIGSECFSDLDKLISVNLGKGVQIIGDGAFSACRKLENIVFSNELKEIGEYAFSDCESICRIQLPDSTETIQDRAFEGCYNLEEMILSKNLKKWLNPGRECPALKRITNLSGKAWKLPSCQNNKHWYVRGKRKDKVLPGEVAVSQGKEYDIQYQLDGGRLVGKMPDSYEYGKAQPIMATVEKEGYYCIGWYKDIEENDDDGIFLFMPEPVLQRDVSGDLLLRPLFVKYRIKNDSKQEVRVVLSDAGSPYVQEYFEIRYSQNQDMTDAKTKPLPDGSDTVVIENLEKGKRYYVEFRWGTSEGNDDSDEPLQPESPWMGKKSVLIKQ